MDITPKEPLTNVALKGVAYTLETRVQKPAKKKKSKWFLSNLPKPRRAELLSTYAGRR